VALRQPLPPPPGVPPARPGFKPHIRIDKEQPLGPGITGGPVQGRRLAGGPVLATPALPLGPGPHLQQTVAWPCANAIGLVGFFVLETPLDQPHRAIAGAVIGHHQLPGQARILAGQHRIEAGRDVAFFVVNGNHQPQERRLQGPGVGVGTQSWRPAQLQFEQQQHQAQPQAGDQSQTLQHDNGHRHPCSSAQGLAWGQQLWHRPQRGGIPKPLKRLRKLQPGANNNSPASSRGRSNHAVIAS